MKKILGLILPKKWFFLAGARQVGKTTLAKP